MENQASQIKPLLRVAVVDDGNSALNSCMLRYFRLSDVAPTCGTGPYAQLFLHFGRLLENHFTVQLVSLPSSHNLSAFDQVKLSFQDKKTDISMNTVSMTAERHTFVQFAAPILQCKVGWIVSQELYRPMFGGLTYYPFTYTFGCCLAISLAIVGCVLAWRNDYPCIPWCHRTVKDCLSNFLNLACLLIKQEYRGSAISSFVHSMIFCTCLLYIFVVMAFYESHMTNSLVLTTQQPFHTYQEAVNLCAWRELRIVRKAFSTTLSLMSNSFDAASRAAAVQALLVAQDEHVIPEIYVNKRLVSPDCIDEATELVRGRCGDFAIIYTDDSPMRYHTYVLPRNSPHSEQVNRLLTMLMPQAEHFFHRFSATRCPGMRTDGHNVAIRLSHLWIAIALHAFGCCLAWLIWLLERFVSRCAIISR